MRTIVSSVERQIMAAGMADGCTVDGRFVKLDFLLTPDYKFAADCYGHQGQNSTYFCLHCLGTKEALLAQETIQQFPGRDYGLMKAIGDTVERHYHTVGGTTRIRDLAAANTD